MMITTRTNVETDRVTAKGGGKQATIPLTGFVEQDSERHAEAAAIVARKHGLTDARSCVQVDPETLRFSVV